MRHRWLAALRRDRDALVREARDRLADSGSSLPAHEIEYLTRTMVNAFLVAASRGDGASFAAAMEGLAEREARAGNALRVEAVLTGCDLVADRLIDFAMLGLAGGGEDTPEDLLAVGRAALLRTYLRAKAAEDERRAMSFEQVAREAEEVPSIVYSTDESGHLTDISHLAAELLGYRKEDLLGVHHSALMDPEDAARYQHFIQERRRDERATRRARIALRAADGSRHDYDVSSRGVYDGEGNYLGSDGVARAAGGTAIQLEYQLDDEGRIRSISEDAATALGFRPEELLGQHFSILMDEQERQRVGRVFGERRTEDRAANRIRIELTGRGGLRRQFEISAVGRYDGDGRFVGTAGLGSDLGGGQGRPWRDWRQRHREVFQQFGIGVGIISPDYRVEEANTWHHRRRRRPLAGTPCHFGLFGKSEPCEWCRLPEVLETGLSARTEAIVSPLDGRSYQLTFSPIRDESGRATAVIETVTDVTAEREAAQQQRAAEKRVAMARVATGLLEPLEDQLTCLGLLADAGRGDELAAELEQSMEYLRRCERINGLSRPWRAASADLNQVVRETLAELAPPDGVQIAAELLPCLPPAAIAPDDATAILRELIANATAAMKRGGTITIETLGDAQRGITLQLTDSGEGLTEATARQAFDPYFTTRAGPHQGLGLSFIQGLVSAQGGTVELASAADAGTSVRIHLPLAGDQPPPVAPRPGPPQPVQLELASRPLAEALEHWLRDRGHRVTAAADPTAVRITDHLTADLTGPAILLVDAGAPREVRAKEGLVLLTKPFTPPQLAEALGQLRR